jgi:gliding motility associated protien GldN
MMEIYIKENIPFRRPIARTPMREADVFFETTVWRRVDLTQRQNLPLYFPVAPNRRIGSRVNLFQLLLEGVERGELTAYDPMPIGHEFESANIRTFEEIISNPGLREADREVTETSLATGLDTTYMRPGFNALTDRECTQLMIKEKIYFDRRHSVLRKEIIGIQPWFVFERTIEGTDEVSIARIPVMWIYYPEARPLLARHAVFNEFNEAQNISFDDFFVQHRYHGVIHKQSSVHDRWITDYMSGIHALFEADRIETVIVNWEQDLWEY